MALELGSARLNVTAKGAPPPPVQQVKPARTSIAEDAIFIPKPHNRVDFKMNVPGGSGETAVTQGGGKEAIKPIPLPGQATDNGGGEMKPIGSRDASVMVTGQNISRGSLGKHGLTAEFGKESYVAPQQLVKTEYNAVPQKDFTAIAPQEEGRQTNHAKQVHYTQQYDAYGRPRIGFSREPYDFAATKYVSKTSQIKFQQNMASTREAYSRYTVNSAAPETLAAQKPLDPNDAAKPLVQPGLIDPEEVKGTKGLIDPKEAAKNFIGADKAPKEGIVAYDPKEANTLGDSAKIKKGMVDAQRTEEMGMAKGPGPKEMLLKGESALTVAQKMGMTAEAIMTPAAVAARDKGTASSTAGQDPLAAFPAAGKKDAAAVDASLGGKAVRDVASMMGMNISAVLTARPEKVADFHATAPLLRSSAAISISA